VYSNWKAELTTRSFLSGDVLGVEVGIHDFAADPKLWQECSPKVYENQSRTFEMKKMYYVRTFRNGLQTTPLLTFPDIPITADVKIGFSLKGRESVTLIPIPEDMRHFFLEY